MVLDYIMSDMVYIDRHSVRRGDSITDVRFKECE